MSDSSVRELTRRLTCTVCLMVFVGTLSLPQIRAADEVPLELVEGQPLAANAERLLKALEFLGQPLPDEQAAAVRDAASKREATRLQKLLDPHVLAVVHINPEVRVKVTRGPAAAVLQQAGWTAHVFKVLNHSTVTARMNLASPQGGARYAGTARFSLQRQQQTELDPGEDATADASRFLALEMFRSQPMTPKLSGLEVEYVIGLVYCREQGKREATLVFDVGQGTGDLGFRSELPILFEARPAVEVALTIRDTDDRPTIARLEITDELGHVYPPQPHRLAPDFFFQRQIYRADGESLWLPPGRFRVRSSRGPEYEVIDRDFEVSSGDENEWQIPLQRWIDPQRFGFYSGDHHIHAAGCAHYTDPSQGVAPADMFRQVKGEGLNVGCVLTWGPCYDHQRQFFSSEVHRLSEPLTLIKYDLEISGFGSQALGHVCLLNLRDQTYPGSEGTKTKGWPTWTTPVMRWAKQQGAITGYAHSASGLQIIPDSASNRLISLHDSNSDKQLSLRETTEALLPQPFAAIDTDGNQNLTVAELQTSHRRVADELPNLAIPEMNGVGAMEIAVTASLGLCDFISAMDTVRIQEWNCWYHLLNCGLDVKVSGETDFPCMSSTRVGQGRVYVQLPDESPLTFDAWCGALGAGRSYVSDGFAHALDFTVNGRQPGFGDVALDAPGNVAVKATVAFAPQMPEGVAYGTLPSERRLVGDTVQLHAPRSYRYQKSGPRMVELVVNGVPVATRNVPADGKIHEIDFGDIAVGHSSWIALRQFPQLHTNPVKVVVAGQPVRASSDSARWCAAITRQLWSARSRRISDSERPEARATFDRAIEFYEAIAGEARAQGR